jgi:hypothetical protein
MRCFSPKTQCRSTGLLLVLVLSLAPFAAADDGRDAERVVSVADRCYEFRLRTRPETAYFAGVELELRPSVKSPARPY